MPPTPPLQKKFQTISGYRLESLSSDDLKILCSAVDTFKIDKIRFTPGSQIAVSGLADDKLSDFVRYLKPLLKPQPTNGISTILNCNDCGECKNGCISTAELVNRLGLLDLPQPMPGRLKVAIAGCPRCCTMPRLRDIGFIPASAKAQTWNIFFGGNGGRKPRIGDQIGAKLTLPASLDLVTQALTVYQREAEDKMRTADYLRSVNLEQFLRKIEKIASIDSGQGI